MKRVTEHSNKVATYAGIADAKMQETDLFVKDNTFWEKNQGNYRMPMSAELFQRDMARTMKKYWDKTAKPGYEKALVLRYETPVDWN